MTPDEKIIQSITLLRTFIESEHYKGYDPYDGLTSPLFRLPILKSNHKLRFLSQQFVKRFPINIRPLLGIQKRLNPVTLGLAIQGYVQMTTPSNSKSNQKKILDLIQELKKLIPTGYSGACWGYDFPWEARYASIPAYQPTLVATGIISNALYLAWKKLGIAEAKELIVQCCAFTEKHIHRSTEADGSFCFSYSPFDKEKVFNASMKGARLMAQGYEITGNQEWNSLAKNAVSYVMKFQREDGAWIYSQRETGAWIDNYHTGYILDCLDEYQNCTHDSTWSLNLSKGIQFYTSTFILEKGQAKFYDKNPWPADCTAAGQTLLSLSRFGYRDLAKKVALWNIENMQHKKGYFYFRKYPYYTNTSNFMRWSNAWMFAGLTTLNITK
jgi:hypothetical protein